MAFPNLPEVTKSTSTCDLIQSGGEAETIAYGNMPQGVDSAAAEAAYLCQECEFNSVLEYFGHPAVAGTIEEATGETDGEQVDAGNGVEKIAKAKAEEARLE